MKITMHTVDLRYTKAERRHLFEVATKEDVEHRGHYECRGGALYVWSHPWINAATRYDSTNIGAFYINWFAERIERIETEEGFDLADLLHELALLELKAWGKTKHGVERV